MNDAVKTYGILKNLKELLLRIGIALLLKTLPGFWLRGLDKIDQCCDINTFSRHISVAVPVYNLIGSVFDV